MSHTALQRIRALLAQMHTQANTLDKNNANLRAHKLLADNALFSESLFTTHSDKFSAYVHEIERKVSEFERLTAAGHKEIAFNQLPVLEQQIVALNNAFKANACMHNEAQHRLNAFKSRRFKKAAQNIMQTSHQLHEKLAETREFERRLSDMITEREQQRTTNTSSDAQQKLSQEILALHQRLGRCRQALSKIERQIEMAEKRSF